MLGWRERQAACRKRRALLLRCRLAPPKLQPWTLVLTYCGLPTTPARQPAWRRVHRGSLLRGLARCRQIMPWFAILGDARARGIVWVVDRSTTKLDPGRCARRQEERIGAQRRAGGLPLRDWHGSAPQVRQLTWRSHPQPPLLSAPP